MTRPGDWVRHHEAHCDSMVGEVADAGHVDVLAQPHSNRAAQCLEEGLVISHPCEGM